MDEYKQNYRDENWFSLEQRDDLEKLKIIDCYQMCLFSYYFTLKQTAR